MSEKLQVPSSTKNVFSFMCLVVYTRMNACLGVM